MAADIFLCAGGTGGHVFPAIALADALLARGFRVKFLTDARGKKYLHSQATDDVIVLSSGTWGRGVMGKIKFIFPLCYGFFQALMLFLRTRPKMVIGFGGYPSAPPVFAAQILGVYTAVHEQNAILGAANNILGFLAKDIFLSFPETSKMPKHFETKTHLVGNPVRAAIAAIGAMPYPSLEDKIHVLVVGGSQGAKVFTDLVPHAFAKLAPDVRKKITVVQQVKEEDQPCVAETYQQAGIAHELKSFFDDMPQRLQDCHFMIARAGASTLSENFAAGRPAFYVPYPWNRDHQQEYNARIAVNGDAGWMMSEKEMTVARVAAELSEVLNAPQILQRKAQAARTLAQHDTAKIWADILASRQNLA